MNVPKIIALARSVSLKSDHPFHKHGCIIFDRKGRVYAKSANFHIKTHPVYSRIAPLKTLHAEAAAILSIRHKTDFSRLSLLVYREHSTGSLAMSRPCEHCLKIIKAYGIKTVWYTTSDGLKKEAI